MRGTLHRKPIKVCIVEDSIPLQLIEKRWLLSRGVVPDCFDSVEKFLIALPEYKDKHLVIITDFNLGVGKMNGVDLVKLLRLATDAKIIATSSELGPEQLFLKLGCMFLAKPLEKDIFLNAFALSGVKLSEVEYPMSPSIH